MGSVSSLKETAAEFSHKPLDLNQYEIRVIRLLSTGNGSIECELKHCTIFEGHICLSYMWGAEDASHTIKINGSRFSVRKNLVTFLKIAQKLELRHWLWIDAICVNQENIEERNHQVQLMADIYRLAKLVYIYPGRLSNLSHQVAKVCTATYLYKILNARVPWPMLPFIVPLRLLTWPFIYQPHHLPYWDRLWIIQELALARERYVVTPGKLLSWEEFEDAFTKHNYAEALPGVWRMCHGWHRWGKQPLDRLISTFAEADCKDERDRVFGLLGLTRSHIKVDYQTSRWSLFCSVVEDMLLDPAYSMKAFEAFARKLAQALAVTGFCICWRCYAGKGSNQNNFPEEFENRDLSLDEWSSFPGLMANSSSSSLVNPPLEEHKMSYILDMSHRESWGADGDLRLSDCSVCHHSWLLRSDRWVLQEVFRDARVDKILLTWRLRKIDLL